MDTNSPLHKNTISSIPEQYKNNIDVIYYISELQMSNALNEDQKFYTKVFIEKENFFILGEIQNHFKKYLNIQKDNCFYFTKINNVWIKMDYNRSYKCFSNKNNINNYNNFFEEIVDKKKYTYILILLMLNTVENKNKNSINDTVKDIMKEFLASFNKVNKSYLYSIKEMIKSQNIIKNDEITINNKLFGINKEKFSLNINSNSLSNLDNESRMNIKKGKLYEYNKINSDIKKDYKIISKNNVSNSSSFNIKDKDVVDILYLYSYPLIKNDKTFMDNELTNIDIEIKKFIDAFVNLNINIKINVASEICTEELISPKIIHINCYEIYFKDKNYYLSFENHSIKTDVTDEILKSYIKFDNKINSNNKDSRTDYYSDAWQSKNILNFSKNKLSKNKKFKENLKSKELVLNSSKQLNTEILNNNKYNSDNSNDNYKILWDKNIKSTFKEKQNENIDLIFKKPYSIISNNKIYSNEINNNIINKNSSNNKPFPYFYSSDKFSYNNQEKTKLAVITSNILDDVRQLFFNLNINCVVIVLKNVNIDDKSPIIFIENFYKSLANGLSIIKSFNLAKELSLKELKSNNLYPCCCNHLHKNSCVFNKYRYTSNIQANKYHNAHVKNCNCYNKEYHIHNNDCNQAKKLIKLFSLENKKLNNKKIKVCCCSNEINHKEYNAFSILFRNNNVEYGNEVLFKKKNYYNKFKESIGQKIIGNCYKNLISDIDINYFPYILGRCKEVYMAVNIIFNLKNNYILDTYMRNKKLITFVSKNGNGSKEVCKLTAKYLWERNVFNHILYIKQNSYATKLDIKLLISKFLKVNIFENEINILIQKDLNNHNNIENKYIANTEINENLLIDNYLIIIETNSNKIKIFDDIFECLNSFSKIMTFVISEEPFYKKIEIVINIGPLSQNDNYILTYFKCLFDNDEQYNSFINNYYSSLKSIINGNVNIIQAIVEGFKAGKNIKQIIDKIVDFNELISDDQEHINKCYFNLYNKNPFFASIMPFIQYGIIKKGIVQYFHNLRIFNVDQIIDKLQKLNLIPLFSGNNKDLLIPQTNVKKLVYSCKSILLGYSYNKRKKDYNTLQTNNIIENQIIFIESLKSLISVYYKYIRLYININISNNVVDKLKLNNLENKNLSKNILNKSVFEFSNLCNYGIWFKLSKPLEEETAYTNSNQLNKIEIIYYDQIDRVYKNSLSILEFFYNPENLIFLKLISLNENLLYYLSDMIISISLINEYLKDTSFDELNSKLMNINEMLYKHVESYEIYYYKVSLYFKFKYNIKFDDIDLKYIKEKILNKGRFQKNNSYINYNYNYYLCIYIESYIYNSYLEKNLIVNNLKLLNKTKSKNFNEIQTSKTSSSFKNLSEQYYDNISFSDKSECRKINSSIDYDKNRKYNEDIVVSLLNELDDLKEYLIEDHINMYISLKPKLDNNFNENNYYITSNTNHKKYSENDIKMIISKYNNIFNNEKPNNNFLYKDSLNNSLDNINLSNSNNSNNENNIICQENIMNLISKLTMATNQSLPNNTIDDNCPFSIANNDNLNYNDKINQTNIELFIDNNNFNDNTKITNNIIQKNDYIDVKLNTNKNEYVVLQMTLIKLKITIINFEVLLLKIKGISICKSINIYNKIINILFELFNKLCVYEVTYNYNLLLWCLLKFIEIIDINDNRSRDICSKLLIESNKLLPSDLDYNLIIVFKNAQNILKEKLEGYKKNFIRIFISTPLVQQNSTLKYKEIKNNIYVKTQNVKDNKILNNFSPKIELEHFLDNCNINKQITITEHIFNEDNFYEHFSLSGRISIILPEHNNIENILIENYNNGKSIFGGSKVLTPELIKNIFLKSSVDLNKKHCNHKTSTILNNTVNVTKKHCLNIEENYSYNKSCNNEYCIKCYKEIRLDSLDSYNLIYYDFVIICCPNAHNLVNSFKSIPNIHIKYFIIFKVDEVFIEFFEYSKSNSYNKLIFEFVKELCLELVKYEPLEENSVVKKSCSFIDNNNNITNVDSEKNSIISEMDNNIINCRINKINSIKNNIKLINNFANKDNNSHNNIKEYIIEYKLNRVLENVKTKFLNLVAKFMDSLPITLEKSSSNESNKEKSDNKNNSNFCNNNKNILKENKLNYKFNEYKILNLTDFFIPEIIPNNMYVDLDTYEAGVVSKGESVNFDKFCFINNYNTSNLNNHLYFRKKELVCFIEKHLRCLKKSSDSDNYSITNLYGVKGVGKNLLIYYCLNYISQRCELNASIKYQFYFINLSNISSIEDYKKNILKDLNKFLSIKLKIKSKTKLKNYIKKNKYKALFPYDIIIVLSKADYCINTIEIKSSNLLEFILNDLNYMVTSEFGFDLKFIILTIKEYKTKINGFNLDNFELPLWNKSNDGINNKYIEKFVLFNLNISNSIKFRKSSLNDVILSNIKIFVENLNYKKKDLTPLELKNFSTRKDLINLLLNKNSKNILDLTKNISKSYINQIDSINFLKNIAKENKRNKNKKTSNKDISLNNNLYSTKNCFNDDRVNDIVCFNNIYNNSNIENKNNKYTTVPAFKPNKINSIITKEINNNFDINSPIIEEVNESFNNLLKKSNSEHYVLNTRMYNNIIKTENIKKNLIFNNKHKFSQNELLKENLTKNNKQFKSKSQDAICLNYNKVLILNSLDRKSNDKNSYSKSKDNICNKFNFINNLENNLSEVPNNFNYLKNKNLLNTSNQTYPFLNKNECLSIQNDNELTEINNNIKVFNTNYNNNKLKIIKNKTYKNNFDNNVIESKDMIKHGKESLVLFGNMNINKN